MRGFLWCQVGVFFMWVAFGLDLMVDGYLWGLSEMGQCMGVVCCIQMWHSVETGQNWSLWDYMDLVD